MTEPESFHPDLPLSIVVVCHDMPREIPRTIRSLSPAMQRGVSAADYEVLLVDNGSTRPPDLTACRSWGANLDCFTVSHPSPSPAAAINQALERARGRLVGVLIDGARLASPGLLATALAASRLHARPVIGTLGFHLGHEVQMVSVPRGYDSVEEDRLLDSVDWTADGYRLFEIAVFAGSSRDGWFAPMSESNALFMPAGMWRELGGYDEGFRLPGGGLVNLDTWARACELPDSRTIVLFGEGTFHQVHGGVSTNAPDSPWRSFHDEYVRLRGKPFARPPLHPLLVGTIDRAVLPSIAWSAQRYAPPPEPASRG